jgi:hypothetical protein
MGLQPLICDECLLQLSLTCHGPTGQAQSPVQHFHLRSEGVSRVQWEAVALTGSTFVSAHTASCMQLPSTEKLGFHAVRLGNNGSHQTGDTASASRSSVKKLSAKSIAKSACLKGSNVK